METHALVSVDNVAAVLGSILCGVPHLEVQLCALRELSLKFIYVGRNGLELWKEFAEACPHRFKESRVLEQAVVPYCMAVYEPVVPSGGVEGENAPVKVPTRAGGEFSVLVLVEKALPGLPSSWFVITSKTIQ